MKSRKDPINREIEIIEKEMLADKYVTALRKVKFINELKSGLGDDIKANPSRVKIIKKSLFQRIKETLKKIFTKF